MQRPTPLLYLSLTERDWARLSALACPAFPWGGRIVALPYRRRLERIGFRWNVFAQRQRASAVPRGGRRKSRMPGVASGWERALWCDLVDANAIRLASLLDAPLLSCTSRGFQ